MSERMHSLRLAKYRLQSGKCWLCGEMLDLFQPVHTYGSASWEHIIPSSSGGSNWSGNLAITHYECNKARGDRFIWRIQRPASMLELSNKYKQKMFIRAYRYFSALANNRKFKDLKSSQLKPVVSQSKDETPLSQSLCNLEVVPLDPPNPDLETILEAYKDEMHRAFGIRLV